MAVKLCTSAPNWSYDCLRSSSALVQVLKLLLQKGTPRIQLKRLKTCLVVMSPKSWLANLNWYEKETQMVTLVSLRLEVLNSKGQAFWACAFVCPCFSSSDQPECDLDWRGFAVPLCQGLKLPGISFIPTWTTTPRLTKLAWNLNWQCLHAVGSIKLPCIPTAPPHWLQLVCPSAWKQNSLHADLGLWTSSGKATPCQIPTYTGISLDNSTCNLSQDIPV